LTLFPKGSQVAREIEKKLENEIEIRIKLDMKNRIHLTHKKI